MADRANIVIPDIPADLPKPGNKKLHSITRGSNEYMYIIMKDENNKRVWHRLSDYNVIKSKFGLVYYEKKLN